MFAKERLFDLDEFAHTQTCEVGVKWKEIEAQRSSVKWRERYA